MLWISRLTHQHHKWHKFWCSCLHKHTCTHTYPALQDADVIRIIANEIVLAVVSWPGGLDHMIHLLQLLSATYLRHRTWQCHPPLSPCQHFCQQLHCLINLTCKYYRWTHPLLVWSICVRMSLGASSPWIPLSVFPSAWGLNPSRKA